MVTMSQARQQRIAALDLIKIFAICGVLLIHLVGKTDFGGIFWYAQAVPIFMVIMGYNCKGKINWRAAGKAYVGYLLLFMASLVLALLANVPLSLRFLPLGFLPFEGPGTYWIQLYFLFIFISPLLSRLRRRVPLHLFLLVLFMSGWAFDMMYELAVEKLNLYGGVIYLYKICPLRYILCFGLGMIIKERSPQWYVKTIWPLACLSAIYLYVRNYTPADVPCIFFENAGWHTGENGFAAFYPAMQVASVMCLCRKMKDCKYLFLGRFTYHVFLFQILWFPVARRFVYNEVLFAILTFACCFSGGFLFYRISNQVNKLIFKK